MLMTFLMVKKNHSQLTFIAQVEIKVQEVFPKEKKEKGTLMTFPMTKKYPSAYLHSPSQNQVQEASLKKKRKRNVNDISNGKKKDESQLTFIAQAKIKVQEVFSKEKKKKKR